MKHRILLTLMVAAVVGLFLWGSQASADGGLDASKADELAHMALPEAGDLDSLSGGGWQVTKQDEFGDDSSVPDTAACKNSQGKLNAIGKSLAPGRAGRSEVEFTKDSDNGPMSIEVSVEIYKDAKALNDAMPQVTAILGGKDLGQCLVDAANASDAQVKVGRLPNHLPKGGAGTLLNLTVPSQKLALHLEIYTWLFGNTAVTVQIAGHPTDVGSDLSSFMLDGMTAALDYLAAN